MKRTRYLVLLFILCGSTVYAQPIIPSPQAITVQDTGAECTTAGTCANWSIPTNVPSVTIQAVGTFSATLTVKASADCASFFTVNVVKLSTGVFSTTFTGTGQYAIANTGIQCLRVVGTTVASGTATLSLVRGAASSALNIATPSSGGTGIDASGVTNGQLLIGQSSDHTLGLATITQGANITITNSGHGITIAAAAGGGFTVTSKTSTYSAAAQDYVVVPSGSFTVTLPAASANANKQIIVTNNGTGTVTIGHSGSDTIGLASTQTLNPGPGGVQGDSMTFTSDGVSNWNIS